MTRVRPLQEKKGAAFATAIGLLHGPLEVLTKRDWQGGEQIPATGGCVVAVNHVSHLDPITLAYFLVDHGRLVRYLAKDALWEVPVLGSIMRNAKQIPVTRQSTGAVRAFDQACAAVRAGELIGVYPEGTITKDPAGWPMRGKTGAARIALATGAPLVPMGQWGTQDVLPAYTARLRLLPRKTLHVRVGEPVDLDDLRDLPLTNDVLRVATDRVMTAITGLVADIRGDDPPAERFDPRAAGVSATGNPNKARTSAQQERRGRRRER